MTLLFITHEIPLMKEMDHIVVLENGKIACQGSHEDLLKNNASCYKRLLGEY